MLPTPSPKPLEAAQAAFDRRAYETALGLARQHLQTHRNAVRASMLVAQALLGLDRTEEASDHVDEALKHHYDTPGLWLLKALIARQRNRRLDAALACLEAIKQSPNHKPAFSALRVLMNDKPKWLEGLIPQLEAIAETPGNKVDRSTLLSVAYANVGSLEEANAHTRVAATSRAARKVEPPAGRADRPANTRNKIDFIIAGAQKAGTTSLHGYLGQHPQVLLPNKKEIHYFSVHYERGLDWYLAHFPPIDDASDFLTGEASPSYFWARDADQRILRDLQPTKVFLLLRNPADRLISAYHHGKRISGNYQDLEGFVRGQLRRKEYADFDAQHDNSAIGVSTYPPKLRRWLAAFGADRCRVILAEPFFADPGAEMRGVFDWIGLDFVQGQYPAANAGAYKKDHDSVRDRLLAHFAGEIREVEDILGRSTGWLP